MWSVVLLAVAGTAFCEEPKQLPEELTVDLGGGVKMELVLIPVGEFVMGSPDSDKDAAPNEKPQHRVRITKPYYLGKHLVTQEQWEALMGSNPSQSKGPKNPVTLVSWQHCQVFLGKLNAKTAGQGGKFVLPSEAQWEYACRAGTTTKYGFGDEETQLGDYAWYKANSGDAPHPVGEKNPNAWGLYDVHG
ncbi:MAG: formylglycine-generating enzyme family protein, partial [Thermoguttaceae bacterium]